MINLKISQQDKLAIFFGFFLLKILMKIESLKTDKVIFLNLMT